MAGMDSKTSPAPEKFSLTKREGGIMYLMEQRHPTEESTEQMKDEVVAMAKTISGSKNLLVNLTGVEMPRGKARQNIIEMLKTADVDHIGFFGPSAPVRAVARFVSMVAGISNMRFFASEKEALDWLRSP